MLKPSMPTRNLMLLLLIAALAGCSNVQAVMEKAKASMPFQKKEKRMSMLEQRVSDFNLAQDRMIERNKLIRQIMADSDGACYRKLGEIEQEVSSWEISSDASDKLDGQLGRAIAMRKHDLTDAEPLIMPHKMGESGAAVLAGAISETIRTSRNKARVSLENRMDLDMGQYSLKQSLIDLQAYHRSCAIDFAVRELARKSAGKMSAEERTAKINELIELRKQLMREGLNPRLVQQKIDALILNQ